MLALRHLVSMIAIGLFIGMMMGTSTMQLQAYIEVNKPVLIVPSKIATGGDAPYRIEDSGLYARPVSCALDNTGIECFSIGRLATPDPTPVFNNPTAWDVSGRFNA